MWISCHEITKLRAVHHGIHHGRHSHHWLRWSHTSRPSLGKPPRSPQVPQRLVAMCKVWGPSFVLGPGTHPQQDLWKGKIISQSSNTHVDHISQSSQYWVRHLFPHLNLSIRVSLFHWLLLEGTCEAGSRTPVTPNLAIFSQRMATTTLPRPHMDK